jgi:hypothetical protein
MHNLSDDKLENWIKLKLNQHGLPASRTYLYQEASSVFTPILDEITDSEIGKPILLFFGSTDRWTVLGTEGIASVHSDNLVEVCLDEIDSLTPVGLDQIPKDQYEYLLVRDKQGNTYSIWAPSGPEFFAFWSILLGLKRMQR